MAYFPKPWQAARGLNIEATAKNGGFLPFLRVGTTPAKVRTKPLARRQDIKPGSQEHVMFSTFEAKKTFSVIVCTVLFSATCVLSAVGPAGAVELRTASAVSSVRA